MSFSFIIPTMGRPSLYSTLYSLTQCAARPEDEVIVVGDGPQPEAKRIVSCFSGRLPVSYHEIADGKCVGGPHRNFAMRIASKTHLSFMDDDDVYAPGGVERARQEVLARPKKILIFKMRAMVKRLVYETLWREPEIVMGNVGTPMFVVPNVKSLLGQWSRQYCSDFHFITGTVEKFGIQNVVWIDEVIANIY